LGDERFFMHRVVQADIQLGRVMAISMKELKLRRPLEIIS
jgi:hypothetical protein